MKTEIRTVTVECEVYIACDGTEFRDKYDCEEYEYQVTEKKLQCYNSRCQKCDFDLCTYVKLVTKEDIENILAVCNYTGLTCKGISDEGIYMYDDKGWINITEVISNIYGGTTEDEET